MKLVIFAALTMHYSLRLESLSSVLSSSSTMLTKLDLTINIIFLFIFLVHLTMIVYQILNPENPEIRVYPKNLKDIKFPIIFRICLTKNVNQTEEFQKGTFQILCRSSVFSILHDIKKSLL